MSQPLWALPKAGQRARVRDLSDAPSGPGTAASGTRFLPGTLVECVHRPAFGAPRVYIVAGACFSLEREMARRIYTEPMEESAHAS